MSYRHAIKIAFAIVFAFAQISGHAADWGKTAIDPMHRIDLRDLGYPLVNEIPSENRAITSLITASDGTVYGGTSGDAGYLLLYHPRTNKVRHLGQTPDKGSIHHAVVEGPDGMIYFGTGKNMFEAIELTPGEPGGGFVDTLLWRDIKNHYSDYPGGRLYRYNPRESNDTVLLPDQPCLAEELAIPVEGEAIYTLASNPDAGEIYGLTYPKGRFFVYDVKTGETKRIGSVDDQIVFHGPERYWRSLPRDLVVADDGDRVFTSGSDGRIVYYSRKSGELHQTRLYIPGDYNYSQTFSHHAVIDCLAKAPSGLIYGGSSDGYLFSLDPEKMELINLGRARAHRRLRCLAVADNGKVYFMAGERANSYPCQGYVYDPQKAGFEELGLLIVDRSPYYYKRGYQFDAMTTGQDGTIYFGESERRANLFLLLPE